MMTAQMKTSKGAIAALNRYGIADAARTRITAQILRNVSVPVQRQQERTSALKKPEAQKQT